MIENIRDIRQEEAAEAYLASNRKSIINAAPRFGKIRTSIKIMGVLKPKKVLICYPRNDIKESWDADFKELSVKGIDFEYITFRSLKHKVKEDYDLFVVDEIQEASRKELGIIDSFVTRMNTLALSGTITNKTEEEILKYTGMTICYRYSITQAVKEGILADYEIFVHKVPLDDKIKNQSKGTRTEKKLFEAYTAVKAKAQSFQEKWMIELKQISLIQHSLAKLNKTRQLIEEFKDGRLLVFTGLTDIADKLEIPVYHSKSKERQIFLDFCRGINYKHLATVKMLQAGITVKPISKGVINYTSGSSEDTAQKLCRFLGFEYDNPSKKAQLHIVTSTEPFELIRMKTALLFFDPAKITYIN